MRCVGTDLKFHWVRHDEDSEPVAAAPVAVDGEGGAAGAAAKSAQEEQLRRASVSDKVMLKRKVRVPVFCVFRAVIGAWPALKAVDLIDPCRPSRSVLLLWLLLFEQPRSCGSIRWASKADLTGRSILHEHESFGGTAVM